jgi:hypothetical protein
MRNLSKSGEIETRQVWSDSKEQNIIRAIEESGNGLGLTSDQLESIERVVRFERAAFLSLLERFRDTAANSQAANSRILSLRPRTINVHILIMVEMLIVTKRVKILVDHLLTVEQRAEIARMRRQYGNQREKQPGVTGNKGQLSRQ